MAGQAAQGQRSRRTAQGGGHREAAGLWVGFATVIGGFATGAVYAAVSLTGTPRVVSIAAVAVLVPLTLGLFYLAFAAHYGWRPFRPPPRPPVRYVSLSEPF